MSMFVLAITSLDKPFERRILLLTQGLLARSVRCRRCLTPCSTFGCTEVHQGVEHVVDLVEESTVVRVHEVPPVAAVYGEADSKMPLLRSGRDAPRTAPVFLDVPLDGRFS